MSEKVWRLIVDNYGWPGGDRPRRARPYAPFIIFCLLRQDH